MVDAGRPLRADAERSVRAILAGAERILRTEPGATMEQIAEAAGVARTTVHRRFATREALIRELTKSVAARFAEAIECAQPETAPPLVALYQAAVNVLRVKVDWNYAMETLADDPAVKAVYDRAARQCEQAFQRAKDAGSLRPDVDVLWASRVYMALLRESADDALRGEKLSGDKLSGEELSDAAIAERATRMLDTLLHGVGVPGVQVVR